MTLSPTRKIVCPCSCSAFFASGGFRYCCKIIFRRSTPSNPFRIGVSTWISNGSALTYLGSLCWISWIQMLMITFASYRFRKKKSRLLLSKITGSPRLILCALTMMSLSDAWRKIRFRRTTLQAWESMMSFNTHPGPTLGSWLTSPTRISLVPTEIALSREYISEISTIDISSTMITSASSGLLSSLSNPPLPSAPPFSSNIRWTVRASNPVVSLMRFAARPVGAAKKISKPSSSK